MIDEGDGPVEGSAHALLYDWFKHLTSLSLLTLGGVLSLSQVGGAGEIKRAVLITVLAFVAVSGVLAFSGADMVVKSRTQGTPLPRYIHTWRGIASVILSMGVGAFLYAFVGAIK
jgi:hypothetical protein